MIYLITGKNGSGKTLFAIEQMYKVLDADIVRPVYTNIDGITHNMVSRMPDDWRQCPDNSIIFIDEAQHVNPFGKTYKDNNNIVLDLALHRKRGFDFWIMTPSARRLSADVLDLVHMHYHVKNILNNKHQSKIYIWDQAQMNTGAVSAILLAIDKYTWRYPKHLYDEYQSAKAGHNKKMYIPKQVFSFAISGIIGLILLIYVVSKALGTVSKPDLKNPVKPAAAQTAQHQPIQQQVVTTTVRPQQQPVVYDPLTPDQRADLLQQQQINYDANKPFENQFSGVRPQLTGCIQMQTKCSCYTQQGTKLDVSIADCKRVISDGMPFNPLQQQNMPVLVNQGEPVAIPEVSS